MGVWILLKTSSVLEAGDEVSLMVDVFTSSALITGDHTHSGFRQL